MNDAPEQDVVVFTEALRLPAAERSAYLDRACAGDHELRRRVQAILRGYEKAGNFLVDPAPGVPAANNPGIVPGEKLGDRVGRYKLLQQIGEGGCGVVFMAEQDEPVRRLVALKVIKPGMDTKSVIARFGAERQALALMDHPNIAHVFDAGTTESGRPFFVMELVRGVKITDYCDKNSLPTNARLNLFIQVCHAVQHAHQKGIIHRDIKPSNILVTTSAEGEALPKIIDFGIAKATTGHRLTDKTLFTAFEMMIGTPAYMSPEQAALSSVDVDTRSDIYSLGVLLYELLTSVTPFDTRELLKAGLDEVRRVIRDQEPASPSNRLSTMIEADLTSLSRHRQAEPLKLIREVRGDLDWIVMKAIEKDRARRYETANGLALDVQRFLRNEAISARPPSKLYKFKKTVLRNKLLFAGIGLIAGLFVVGLTIVTISLARERQAHREAETHKTEAQNVTQFLQDMLQGVGPSVARGRDTALLREILDQTAERVGKELTNQPAVEAELRNLIGTLYQRIGKFDRAEEMHRAALAIRRKIFGSQSPEVAASLNDLGLDFTAGNKLSEAERADGEALAIRRRLFGNEHADTATSLNDLGAVYREEGRLAEAEMMAREALEIREKLFGMEHLDVADSRRNLSIILGDEGKWPESEAMAREVLAMRLKLLSPEHPWVASALDDVARAAGARGKLDEAETLEREALAIRQKFLPADHPDVAKSLYLVGDRMRQRGNLDAASVLSAAYSIQSKVLGEDNLSSLDTLRSLELTLEAAGKVTELEQLHRQALAGWRERGETQNPQALSELDSLVRVLKRQKKFSEAEKLLDDALTPAFVGQASSASLLESRADLLGRRERWQEAAADASRALEYQPSNRGLYAMVAALFVGAHDRAAYEQFCNRLMTTFGNTTNIYVADQVAKACLFLPGSGTNLEVFGRLADMTVTQGVGDPYAMPFFQDCKALSEYRQGHYAEAVEWAQKPLKIAGVYVHGHAFAVLAMAYWRLGEKAEARAMLAKGEKLAPRIMPADIAEEPGNAWLAWLFARIQLDEATALIQPASSNVHN